MLTPDNEPLKLTAITISIVHLRRVLSILFQERRDLKIELDLGTVSKIMLAVQGLHYTERTIKNITDSLLNVLGLDEELVRKVVHMLSDRTTNPKFLDAQLAFNVISNHLWVGNPNLVDRRTAKKCYGSSLGLSSARTCEVCSSKLEGDYIFCPICCNLCHEQ
jgi:hypothetical protein